MPLTPEEFTTDVEAEIDLYDSELLEVRRVVSVLSEAQGTTRDLEGFRREVVDRFAEVGLVVDVRVYEARHENRPDVVHLFKIVLTGRTEPLGEFDHERQAHEVRANLLDQLGQEDRGRTQVQGGFSRQRSGLYVPGS